MLVHHNVTKATHAEEQLEAGPHSVSASDENFLKQARHHRYVQAHQKHRLNGQMHFHLVFWHLTLQILNLRPVREQI